MTVTTGPLAVGIDIGGTKIGVALICLDALAGTDETVASIRYPTRAAEGFDSGLQRIVDAIDGCLRRAGRTREALEGIGIGCAGPVHPGRGTIDNPHTLPTWDGVNIVAPLQAEFGVRTVLENDADAAAVGEAYFGAGAGKRSVVMLTYGTGIGSGALFDGHIYRGAMQTHPELGHLPCDPSGPECYCGIRGCFESIASGTAISAAGETAGIGDARAVFAAYQAGDAAAREIIDRALRATHTAVWAIQHSLLPERIILGGGIIDEHFELFAGAARRAIDGAVMNPRGATDVVRAALGNRAGIVGAAQLVRIGA